MPAIETVTAIAEAKSVWEGKKLLLPLLAAAMLLLTGCGAFLEKDYLIVAPYETETPDEGWSMGESVHNYSELLRALNQLVSDHTEQEILTFSGYDGDVTKDLAAAKSEIETGTALGAYVVDNLFYDISRFVSYDAAAISITYKRTAEEAGAVIGVSGQAGLKETLLETLSGYGTHLAVSMNTSLIDADAVKEMVSQLFYENPLEIVVFPTVEVEIFPESGFQKIIDISPGYSYGRRRLEAMESELIEAVRLALGAGGAQGETPSEALKACRALARAGVYDPAGEMRRSEKADAELGKTAYGALVEGAASSEGFAMAYKALCDTLGIECIVIQGRYEKDEHFWCVIMLDGDYYHVDPSLFTLGDESGAFMRSDSDMWGTYTWDTDVYPPCEGALTYQDADPSASAAAD